MNFRVIHPCNNVGLWTVNKKSEECVTLYSDFLEMSYELNIKMKYVAPLLLGNVKNLLIPPRTEHVNFENKNYDMLRNSYNSDGR